MPHSNQMSRAAIGILLVLAPVAGAQQSGPVVYKRPEELRIPLRRARRPPVIDGRLDDSVWNEAVPMRGFVQYEPVDSVLPPQQSIGYVSYDADNLYVAFRAFEPDRGDIRATVHPRERGGEVDDKVAVAIDTFNDDRRIYVFRVSPIGIQFDGVKTEGSRTDDTHDFIWKSAGRIDAQGWVAELAIPFASIKLPAGDSLDFGIDFVRYHGKAGVRSSWAPRRHGSPCDICQNGTLVGLKDISASRSVDFLPYMGSTSYGTRAFASDSVLQSGNWVPLRRPSRFDQGTPTTAVGADVRLKLTPSLGVNVTLNPDFSQVESDDEQIRVNQRFALFYQERRPFFLDSRDVFEASQVDEAASSQETTGKLLYTRAVVDPSAGVRLTGKTGALTYGALYARDAAPAWLHYEGYESSGIVEHTGVEGDAFVGRVRADVLSDSWLGATVLGRTAGGSRDLVGAGDVSLRRGLWVLRAQAGWSTETALLDTARSPFLDGESRTGGYYAASLRHSSRNVTWTMAASGISPGYRNQLGRYSRVGVEGTGLNLEINSYPEGGTVQRVTSLLKVTRTAAWGGRLLDYDVLPTVRLTFRSRAVVSGGGYVRRTTLSDAALDLRGLKLTAQINSFKLVSLDGSLEIGDREVVSSSNPRVGKGFTGSATVTIRPLPQVRVDAKAQRAPQYESWGGVLITDASILRVRGLWQLTRALGVRLVGEYSNQYDVAASSPFNSRTIRYSSSVLLSLEMAPGSFLYAGFNDALQDFDSPVLDPARRLRTGNQYFVKASYLFRM